MQALFSSFEHRSPSIAAQGNSFRHHTSKQRNPVFFHVFGEPAEHSKHKIGIATPSSQDLKQRGNPVEGPNIIYEVASASTARVSGIDPLGSRCSKNG